MYLSVRVAVEGGIRVNVRFHCCSLQMFDAPIGLCDDIYWVCGGGARACVRVCVCVCMREREHARLCVRVCAWTLYLGMPESRTALPTDASLALNFAIQSQGRGC